MGERLTKMCGIYGTTRDYTRERVAEKLARARFRGPDATGIEQHRGVTLGHNRLAILDLDPRANQPFRYQDLRLVHNGEIYNFRQLRKELEGLGYTFTTESDTEVVAASYAAWGTECAKKLNGMFAFVILDPENQTLFGARDRLGQKPLYYSLAKNELEFASQPSQIAIGNSYTIDEKAVSQFLRWKYVPVPGSIYKEIKKLRPGHWFSYNLNTKDFRERCFWDLPPHSPELTFDGTYNEAQEKLHAIALEAVRDRLVSDVPLGLFLSGGIDSSLVTALAQASSSAGVRTFCIQFDEAKFDESAHAREVSKILGTDHTEIPCNYEEGIELIENLPEYYDEPFADSSAIPSMLLAKHTRRHVTVALSGDAGDESFLGYNQYQRMAELKRLFLIPRVARSAAAKLGKLIPGNTWRQRIQNGIGLENAGELHYAKMGALANDWIVDRGLGDHEESKFWLRSESPLLERLSRYDLKTYLLDDINVKVDRATMAFSLEARAPLEDHRVVEFGLSLPTHFKYDRGNKKRILKDLLAQYIPRETFERPKTGFGMPLEVWFRTRLRDFVRDTLSEERTREIPNVDPQKVTQLVQQHDQQHADHSPAIWRLLVIAQWFDAHGQGRV